MNITADIPSMYRNDLQELRMFDDDFFRKVITHKQVAEAIIEAILGNKDIIEYQSQKDMNYSPKKSIIPDVYVVTEKEVINIEVEKHKERLEPKRARYSTSLLDVDTSEKGMRYEDMKGIKVIFLCEFDPFNEGLGVYHIRDCIEEMGVVYEDEREYIYINGNYEGNDRIGSLVHDLRQKEAKEMHIPKLREVMRYYKETREGAKEMCEIFENIERRGRKKGRKEGKREGKREGRKEGRKEGREEGKIISNINAIRNIMDSFHLTVDEAMKVLKISKNQYSMYKELITNSDMN